MIKGGHASQKIEIPDGVEVVKVEVAGDSYNREDYSELIGLRFHLLNGQAAGELHNSSNIFTLGIPSCSPLRLYKLKTDQSKNPRPMRKSSGFMARVTGERDSQASRISASLPRPEILNCR
jgi:hypothetical protein